MYLHIGGVDVVDNVVSIVLIGVAAVVRVII